MSVLRKKIELLCKGVNLESGLLNGLEVRKGGAGPFGGGYFFLEDHENIINLPFWYISDKNQMKSNFLLKKRNNHFEVLDIKTSDLFCTLNEIKAPKFYNIKTTDGLNMKQIARIHGTDCLATTIYQKCRYWRCGEMCKFCGIELSLNSGDTILEKNYNQISEVIHAAKSEGRCNHITLTSGFTAEDDKGLNRYINIIKNLKNEFPKLTVHAQIEPLECLDSLNQLKEAGTDTIGIHIEILDDLLRNMITPGKAKIPYELYEENWKRSIEIFGKNQVETFLLCGFGEDVNDFINSLEKVISLGVIPYIVPVRSIPDKIFKFPRMNVDFFLRVYNKAAKMMHDYGVNPLENLAGCVRCGCCSAIIEAYSEVS